MMWIAISENGFSEPVFFESGLAVNSQVYINKCLPKVKKFIDTHHKNDEVLFWPDLASSHYAKNTLTALDAMNVKYVPKRLNPPNVPQLRPIEDFWANLKRKVYSNSYVAPNTTLLKLKIKKELRLFDKNGTMEAMRAVPLKCRNSNRMGVNSSLH